MQSSKVTNVEKKLTSDRIKQLISQYSILLILIIMVLVLSIIEPRFLRPMNLLNIVRQITLIAIIGFGVTMIIITTGIDLSSGSVIGLAGIVTAVLAQQSLDLPLIVVILGGLIVGALAGLINGILVAHAKLPAFIATLGMMITARGLVYIVCKGHPVILLTPEFNAIGTASFMGIPVMIYVLFACMGLSYFILRHMKTGKCIYAIGGNQQAAVVSGINVKKNLLFVYIYGSMMAAVSGILLTARLSSGQPLSGEGYELDAIAGVVIGGTSLSGGIGTIQGTLIGALIIGVLNNGMDLLHVPAYYQQVMKGLIIVGAVLLDKVRNR